MNARSELTPATQQALLARHGGSVAGAFAELASECVRQFLEQNDLPGWPQSVAVAFCAHVWTVVNEAGLPRPLPDNEAGEATEMPAERIAAVAQRVWANLPSLGPPDAYDVLTRQLLKACLQPEFRQCRESYKEVVEGRCRRQELGRARQRLSGSHCVDCPYWVALRPDQHAAVLEKGWSPASTVPLAQYRDIFLPEKFRALRLFLWRQARHVNELAPLP